MSEPRPDEYATDAEFVAAAKRRCGPAMRNTATGAWLAEALRRLSRDWREQAAAWLDGAAAKGTRR